MVALPACASKKTLYASGSGGRRSPEGASNGRSTRPADPRRWSSLTNLGQTNMTPIRGCHPDTSVRRSPSANGARSLHFGASHDDRCPLRTRRPINGSLFTPMSSSSWYRPQPGDSHLDISSATKAPIPRHPRRWSQALLPASYSPDLTPPRTGFAKLSISSQSRERSAEATWMLRNPFDAFHTDCQYVKTRLCFKLTANESRPFRSQPKPPPLEEE